MPPPQEHEQSHVPLVLLGLGILLLLLAGMLLHPKSRLWAAKEFRSRQSVPLVLLGFAFALLLLTLLLAVDAKDTRISQFCLWRTECPQVLQWIERVRGQNYSLDNSLRETDPEEYERRRCNLATSCGTGWSALHFATYMILGFIAPQLWPVLLAVGVGWEVYEMRALGGGECHDWLDVVYNSGGLLSGVLLRNALTSPTRRDQTQSRSTGQT